MGASDLDDVLREAAAVQNRTLNPDPEPEKGFYYRSDHFNFAKVGVPALYTDTGVKFIGKDDKYSQTKRDEYTANDYHKPSDQIKPDWDLSGAVEDAQLLWLVGYRVANADRIPEWKPGNEFKARRDEMMKEGDNCGWQLPTSDSQVLTASGIDVSEIVCKLGVEESQSLSLLPRLLEVCISLEPLFVELEEPS